MNNLKVGYKLAFSFFVVTFLALVLGILGIFGMSKINAADDSLYNGNYLPTVMAGSISENILLQRIYMRNFIIYDSSSSDFRSAETGLTTSKQKMEELMAQYDPTIVLPEDRAAFDEFVKLYRGEWQTLLNEVHDYGALNMSLEAEQVLTAGLDTATRIDELTSTLQDINIQDGGVAVNANTDLYKLLRTVSIALIVFSAVASFMLAFIVTRSIRVPLGVLTGFMNVAGSTGNLTISRELEESLSGFMHRADEIGQCVSSTKRFIDHVTEMGTELQAVASGDLTINVKLLSNEDTLGVSVNKMVENLNNMFAEINTSTAQVNLGAKQIADGSQALAQGSTEQAAAVQQLSSSISEIAQKTKDNAEMANRAAALADSIKHNAEKGSGQMDQMMNAVKDINQASQSINKVIKVIDDIAFQTNILALNAAVEAARAGQHGKGFAVVAEEVRNLAAKSAEAAKDTGGLIANSMEKAELGAKIADETSASLVEIVSGINESSTIVGEIARSSTEQSEGISQVNKGIEQVAQVVQQNSATAEESAAASEEMSGQADMLESLISQFKLKGSGGYSGISSGRSGSGTRSLPKAGSHSEPSQLPPSNIGGDYGKY